MCTWKLFIFIINILILVSVLFGQTYNVSHNVKFSSRVLSAEALNTYLNRKYKILFKKMHFSKNHGIKEIEKEWKTFFNETFSKEITNSFIFKTAVITPVSIVYGTINTIRRTTNMDLDIKKGGIYLFKKIK